MFGSGGSPTKDRRDAVEDLKTATEHLEDSKPQQAPVSPTKGTPPVSTPAAVDGSPDSTSTASMGKKADDTSPNGEKRSRRASGVSKARELFSSAKQSFSPSPPRVTEKVMQTPIQKLGKTDPALSVPQGSLNNAAGESAPGPRSTFRVGVTEDKNKKCRRTMEDTHSYLYNFLSTPAPALDASFKGLAHTISNSSTNSNTPVVETDNGYFAIFDGHAGTFAAEWCGKKLHLILEDLIRKNPNRAIPELLDETFTTVDHQLEKLPLKNSGTTAVIAVLRWEDRIPNSQSATGSTSIAPAAAAEVAKSSPGDEQAAAPSTSAVQGGPQAVEAKLRENSSRQRVLYTANVGDARIILCRNGKALRLSYDHKGSDDNEGKRIANAGGLILNNRVNGVLAVTRALGDAYMKDLVTGHPYTTETVIQPDSDEFLILACDGLWDVCSDQEAVDLVRSTQDPQVASKMLVEHALTRFSTDNLSCMIVRFNTRAVQDTVEQRSEPIGVDGDPMSTRGGISETESIISAARRDLAAAQSSEEMANVDGEQGLSRITTDMEKEQEEDRREQEPGPELDPDGLQKAREKAREGQMKEPQGSGSDNSASSH